MQNKWILHDTKQDGKQNNMAYKIDTNINCNIKVTLTECIQHTQPMIYLILVWLWTYESCLNIFYLPKIKNCPKIEKNWMQLVSNIRPLKQEGLKDGPLNSIYIPDTVIINAVTFRHIKISLIQPHISRLQILNRQTFKALPASELINLPSLVGRFYAGISLNIWRFNLYFPPCVFISSRAIIACPYCYNIAKNRSHRTWTLL